jgi:PAS domain S-box-containing protein
MSSVWCERLRADDYKRNSELFRCAPVGMLVVNVDGEILDLNEKAIELLGSPSQEDTKRINMLTYQPLVDAGVSKLVQLCMQGQRATTDLAEYTTKWGKRLFVRFSAAPLYDEDGEICLALFCLEDISNYESAREELRKVNNVLKTLIDSIGYYIWYKDLDGKYIQVNRAFADFCGIPCNEIKGKTDLDIWGREIARAVTVVDKQVVDNGEPITYEEAIQHPELGLRHFRTYKSPVINRHHDVYATVGVAIDITDEKHQDQVLVKAIKTLTASLSENPYEN